MGKSLFFYFFCCSKKCFRNPGSVPAVGPYIWHFIRLCI